MSAQQHGHLPAELMAKFPGMSPEERIRATFANKAPNDQRLVSKFMEEQCQLREVKILSEKHAIVTFAFKVDRFYCNGSGNLHGGSQSAFYDVCTSIALMGIGKPGFWINGGVSRTLNVTYLRPAPEGTDLLMECEVVHMARSLALLKGRLMREDNGAIISVCEHDKAFVPSKPGMKL
jgi:acyl-coenzyme A thioesterase 13